MSLFWTFGAYPMMIGHVGYTKLWNLCYLFLSIYMFEFLKILRGKPFDVSMTCVLNFEFMFQMFVFILKLQPTHRGIAEVLIYFYHFVDTFVSSYVTSCFVFMFIVCIVSSCY